MDRDELEATLARRVARVERAYYNRIRDAVQGGLDADAVLGALDGLAADLAAAMAPVIAQAAQEYVDENADPVGVPLDEVAASVSEWASEHAARVAAGIAESTRRLIMGALAAASGAQDFLERISFRFGPAHAAQVAVTEVTRGISRGAAELQQRLGGMGVVTVRRWLTAEDERVCPICRPLDHKTYESGAWDAAGVPDGPPAHPNCRCVAVVEWTEPS